MVSLNSPSLPQPPGFQLSPVVPCSLLTTFLVSAVSADVMKVPLCCRGRLLLLSPHCWGSLGSPRGWSWQGLLRASEPLEPGMNHCQGMGSREQV